MSSPNQTILITGVSSGIGHGLAKQYLASGHRVLGTSRRTPEDLTANDNFTFVSADLTNRAATSSAIETLMKGVDQVNIAILNAGVLGTFGDMADADLDEAKHVMDVNVWSNKNVIDALFDQQAVIDRIVTVSSGASVNGHRGWRGYAISKAALNMLTMLYAKERPETHFCALAPGLVDTAMQDQLCGRAMDERFDSIEALKSKRGTEGMPTPDAAAMRLIEAIDLLPSLVASGDYADVRKMPLTS